MKIIITGLIFISFSLAANINTLQKSGTGPKLFFNNLNDGEVVTDQEIFFLNGTVNASSFPVYLFFSVRPEDATQDLVRDVSAIGVKHLTWTVPLRLAPGMNTVSVVMFQVKNEAYYYFNDAIVINYEPSTPE